MSAHPIVGVSLRVPSLSETLAFYTDLVGLELAEDTAGSNGEASLVAPGSDDVLVRLLEAPDAPRAPNAVGLFHLAVRYPSREALSQALRRLRDAGYDLTGASDHEVSEALYMNDPAGNGVELYRDRPENEWEWDEHQQVHMVTDSLNLGDLLSASDAATRGAPSGTDMGHVHLEVTDVEESRAFYASAFGLDLTAQRPRARFMSWDGYHHHVGLNSWRRRSESRPVDALGLAEIVARVPGARFEQLSELAETASSNELLVSDPDGLRWRVRRAS